MCAKICFIELKTEFWCIFKLFMLQKKVWFRLIFYYIYVCSRRYHTDHQKKQKQNINIFFYANISYFSRFSIKIPSRTGMQPPPPWLTKTAPPSTRCWAQTRGALLGEGLLGNGTSRTEPASYSTPGNSVPQMGMYGKVRFAPGDGYVNMHTFHKQIQPDAKHNML